MAIALECVPDRVLWQQHPVDQCGPDDTALILALWLPLAACGPGCVEVCDTVDTGPQSPHPSAASSREYIVKEKFLQVRLHLSPQPLSYSGKGCPKGGVRCYLSS